MEGTWLRGLQPSGAQLPGPGAIRQEGAVRAARAWKRRDNVVGLDVVHSPKKKIDKVQVITI